MTMLSVHFSLSEMTITQVRDVDNTPSKEIILNLTDTAEHMELIRSYLNHPIIVSSGYRSPEVNKRIGGAKDSAHMRGFAVDFIAPKFGTPLEVCHAIKDSGIKLDCLIQEGSWVHCSFKPPMRNLVLTKVGKDKYISGLTPLKKKELN